MPENATRIDELLAAMTPEEKAGQLVQFFHFGDALRAAGDDVAGDAAQLADQPQMVEDAARTGGVGALLFVRTPSEINRLQRMVIEGNRLGIPALFGYDVIHGLRTILPVPIGLAATWDPALIERAQSVAAAEARAVGLHWTFAPMVDVTRDPRWGRIVEGAGEDPHLGAAVAAAQVRGFQGDDPSSDDRVLAGPKHCAGYGFSVGGRDYEEVDVSDATLHNVVFPPFHAAVQAGARAVMSAYMDLNGIPATANRWLLTQMLREEWGFDGFVVSDAMAVHNLVTQGFAHDLRQAGVRALTAGCDLEMAIRDPAFAHLPDALASGTLEEADLDTAVRRVLQAKADLGLFEQPYVDEARAATVLADPRHRMVAREAAERAAVLLRNEGELLPLDANAIDSIAVVGPLADSPRDTLGPWVFDHDLDETVTILAGLRQRLTGEVDVRYARGIVAGQRQTASIFDVWGDNTPLDPQGFDEEAEFAHAVKTAEGADVAVVVIGEWQNQVGEQAARCSLELPGRQRELVQAVVATGTPTVVVVMSGRPLDLRWAAQNVPAILEVWYPGTRGGEAVARLLCGDVSPGGRLPFTWPRSVGQVPMTYSHTVGHDPTHQHERYWDEPSSPLFVFGHGLSYSQFEYGLVSLDRTTITLDELAAGREITAAVEVANVGRCQADEVAQLYVHQRYGTSSRPVRLLKGFQRVALAPGESVRLEFAVGADELRYWNAASRRHVIDPADYVLGIGGDSATPLTAEFAVVAPRAGRRH